MSKSQILGAYRLLRRTSNKTFQGDIPMILESRKRIREAFDTYSTETDSAKIQQLLQDARDAADFLRTSIVQAPLNERGSYELNITDDTLNEGGNYVFQSPSMDLYKEKPKEEKQ
eukprot:TRINITY_DN35627_c0_g2_i1.p4 TRINITY_DN35627_c0_g2~~TRINITY_DN35627_c0_g2_i1.p4  ORF type:complete len:126 (-),score=9.30 TRINITY_DN35627_c0_g2_i1:115-459(-)